MWGAARAIAFKLASGVGGFRCLGPGASYSEKISAGRRQRDGFLVLRRLSTWRDRIPFLLKLRRSVSGAGGMHRVLLRPDGFPAPRSQGARGRCARAWKWRPGRGTCGLQTAHWRLGVGEFPLYLERLAQWDIWLVRCDASAGCRDAQSTRRIDLNVDQRSRRRR